MGSEGERRESEKQTRILETIQKGVAGIGVMLIVILIFVVIGTCALLDV